MNDENFKKTDFFDIAPFEYPKLSYVHQKQIVFFVDIFQLRNRIFEELNQTNPQLCSDKLMDYCFYFAIVVKEVVHEVDWTFINEDNLPTSEIYSFIRASSKVGLQAQNSKDLVTRDIVKEAMKNNLQGIINKAIEPNFKI